MAAFAAALSLGPRALGKRDRTPGGDGRTHRDGFPVRWTARQRLDPVHHRIYFTHVRGISRGMEVTWFLEADGPLVHVRIVHDLTWRWPPIGPLIAHYIIGELFVSNIASKTLRTIKQHVEEHGASRSC
jgi:hypothetical protein